MNFENLGRKSWKILRKTVNISQPLKWVPGSFLRNSKIFGRKSRKLCWKTVKICGKLKIFRLRKTGKFEWKIVKFRVRRIESYKATAAGHDSLMKLQNVSKQLLYNFPIDRPPENNSCLVAILWKSIKISQQKACMQSLPKTTVT